jgi:ABC-type polysaccharide/polyol phosphate transport system ATPase subunit
VTGAPNVVVRDLWERYRTRTRTGRRREAARWALRAVDLEVAPGEALGLVGRNGSGKTTMLQVLAGVLTPTRGDVWVRGTVASLVELSAGFHRDLTGHENIVVGGALLGMDRATVAERYHDIVAFSGLRPDDLRRPLAQWSAGMGLRLGFSVVIHTDPQVLLVDEVLAVGDAEFQEQCLERIDQLRALGCSLVMASHDLAMVRAHCDRVAVLDAGDVVALAAPDEALAAYRARGTELGPVPEAGPARLFGTDARTLEARRRRGA